MMTRKIIPFLFLLIFACSPSTEKTSTEVLESSKDSLTIIKNDVATINSNDILVIDSKSAVFYSPDSLKIEKLKKAHGEEDFYIGADDYLNYVFESREFLKETKLPIIDAKGKKYIKFKVTDKLQTIIKLDTLTEPWGVYFFDPKKNAMQADMLRINEEYTNYFK
jgi:hypothetical protein